MAAATEPFSELWHNSSAAAALLRRQADVRDGVGQVSAGADSFLQSLEIGAGLKNLVDVGRIKEDADRICGKLRRSTHVFARKHPIEKIVAWQLNEIALGVLVIE